MKKMIAGALALGMVTGAVAGAIDEPVLGLDLGKPWIGSLPECPSYGQIYSYCGYRITPASRGLQLIKRPTKADGIPSWAKETLAIVIDPDGILASVMVFTPGPASQEAVIESVSNRFGPPTNSTTRQATNAYGATWAVTKATWDLPDVKIRFDCSRRDECALRFVTPAEAAAEVERFRNRREKDKM